jgi:hypothetical protein
MGRGLAGGCGAILVSGCAFAWSDAFKIRKRLRLRCRSVGRGLRLRGGRIRNILLLLAEG